MRRLRAPLRADPEILRSAREVCPKCGERKVHKLMSSPAISSRDRASTSTTTRPRARREPIRRSRRRRRASSKDSDLQRARLLIRLERKPSSSPTRRRPTRKTSLDRRLVERETSERASFAVPEGAAALDIFRGAGTRGMPRSGLGASARSTPSPADIPACCRCRGASPSIS